MISVVIPLFNKEDYVARAVGSVMAQEYQDFEVLVVDDGSTDAGAARLEEAFGGDPRLRIVRQPNGGVGAARNRGLTEAAGGYVALLDADDEWLPNHLTNIAETVSRFPEAGVIGTGYRLLCSKGYVAEIHVDSAAPTVVGEYFSAASFVPVLTMSSCAVKKQAAEVVGGFCVGEKWGEDPEFEARLALHFPVACHPEVTAVYHREIESTAIESFISDGLAVLPLVARRVESWQREAVIPTEMLDSLRGYAGKLILDQVELGISMGNARDVVEMLDHPLVQKTRWRRRSSLVRFTVKVIPNAILSRSLRLARSRLFHPSLRRRNGVVFRCVRRFGGPAG